jgi:hypothetical protein
LFLTTLQLVIHLIYAWLPLKKALSAPANISVGLGILVVLGVFLRNKPWFAVIGPPPAIAATAVRTLQAAVGIALGLIAVVTVIRICSQMTRLRVFMPVRR